tara:strand:- start:318 stop:485 length:168 start_codon:yes stop_codon:yes gene_type:complete
MSSQEERIDTAYFLIHQILDRLKKIDRAINDIEEDIYVDTKAEFRDTKFKTDKGE